MMNTAVYVSGRKRTVMTEGTKVTVKEWFHIERLVETFSL